MNQAELFLSEIKRLLRQNKCVFLGERDKNKRTLLSLGWSYKMMIDFIINELTVKDIYRSKVEIKDSKLCEEFGELLAYEFKKYLQDEGIEIFIRLAKAYGRELVVIISFHECER